MGSLRYMYPLYQDTIVMPKSIVKHLYILDVHVNLLGTHRLSIQGPLGSVIYASLATTTESLSSCVQKLYTAM